MSNFVSMNTYTPSQEATEPQESYEPQVRVNQGTTSLKIGNGKAETSNSSYSSITSADLNQEDGDWRSTARTTGGNRAGTLTPDTIVRIDGFEGRIKEFMNDGVLRETAPGVFELASNRETPKGTLSPGEDPSHPDHAAIPDNLNDSINDAVSVFSDSALEVGTALGLDVATGDMDFDTLKIRIAQQSGVEPQEAAQRIQFVWNALEAQTNHYLGKQGISAGDREEFYEFAQSQKGELKNALQAQVYGKDMSHWKGLVDKFYANVPPTPEALAKAGLEVKGNLVKLNGDWMPIAAAAKMGMI